VRPTCGQTHEREHAPHSETFQSYLPQRAPSPLSHLGVSHLGVSHLGVSHLGR
jgi:hypothetical protein